MATALAVLPVTLPAPECRPRRFALTPLADVVFQLLIFFMLSSSLAPYTLIPLTASGGGSTNVARSEAGPETWQLGAGTVRIERDSVPLSEVAPRIGAARAAGVEEIVVFAAAEARAQDVATLLAALRAAGMPSVRLVDRAAGPGAGEERP